MEILRFFRSVLSHKRIGEYDEWIIGFRFMEI
jgi:hypothetical protein